VVFRWNHTWDVTPESPVRTLVTWVKTLWDDDFAEYSARILQDSENLRMNDKPVTYLIYRVL